MNKYQKILQPSVEKARAVDLIPEEQRTWEQKMIYAINHSQTVDEDYFKSDCGEVFTIGDKRLDCFIKEHSDERMREVYRSTRIKANQIGDLYDLIEDDFSKRGHIVVKRISVNEKKTKQYFHELKENLVKNKTINIDVNDIDSFFIENKFEIIYTSIELFNFINHKSNLNLVEDMYVSINKFYCVNNKTYDEIVVNNFNPFK